MARLNEIKDRQVVVQTIGGFANSLQQIAAMRMMKLRDQVLASKRFVEESTIILRELSLEKDKYIQKELDLNIKHHHLSTTTNQVIESRVKGPIRTAIIAVTSDVGLCGSYNVEIFRKLDKVINEYPDADYYIIGHKGQNFAKTRSQKLTIKYYPYNIPEEVGIDDLKPLIDMFYYYQQIFIVYSKYINTTTRDVDFVELAVPNIKEVEVQKEKELGKYIFEPSLNELIESVTSRIRYALFRQQILDSKLSLYTAQMIAMKTASDNAEELMIELRHQYNKARRKLVDKKIQEIQSGRVLWEED